MSSVNILGKLDNQMPKNETGPLFFYHRQKLTQNGLKSWSYKFWKHKNSGEKYRKEDPWHLSWEWFFLAMIPKHK